MTATIRGLSELNAKLNAPYLVGDPGRNLGERWGSFVERGAKAAAPHWRGHLRRSLTHEVDPASPPKYARAGTNIPYGPAMEGGTGLLADLPGGKGGRHWPPGAALDPWARAHGFLSGYQVAAAIGKRGGLKPRRFLRNAAAEAEGRIPGWMAQMAKEIESHAAIGGA